ncbi:hypothetical protein PNOK_0432200 [Pyrrhoderma noxium]|uniref:Uncharacterized protein n=1 Tax=Pyrrhoderma noxium TaxID=2282107 RepID=A0A286UIK6_9AGAM|nr:hypothetical protein PNOK_0432200 [Pyrrhoderma noxium]
MNSASVYQQPSGIKNFISNSLSDPLGGKWRVCVTQRHRKRAVNHVYCSSIYLSIEIIKVILALHLSMMI